MTEDKQASTSPIGVFDSGYGGLTILGEFQRRMPQYDYIYLGDNARAPYGSRSFDIVYRFTLQAVEHLFAQGCQLVILACNTASAKALRTIQQNDLPKIDSNKRVLGVIRPTAEEIGRISKNGKVGIFGTPGTIQSQSYEIEIEKLHPSFSTFGHACPMWVPLVENKEFANPGADYFVKKDIGALLDMCPDIDSVILGCTHYPLLLAKIKEFMPKGISIVPQGKIVSESLKVYLQRHPEMEQKCSKGETTTYLTTESETKFRELASIFLQKEITAQHIDL